MGRRGDTDCALPSKTEAKLSRQVPAYSEVQKRLEQPQDLTYSNQDIRLKHTLHHLDIRVLSEVFYLALNLEHLHNRCR